MRIGAIREVPTPAETWSHAASSGAAEEELVETFKQPPEGRNWVALVEDGALADRQRVALALHP